MICVYRHSVGNASKEGKDVGDDRLLHYSQNVAHYLRQSGQAHGRITVAVIRGHAVKSPLMPSFGGDLDLELGIPCDGLSLSDLEETLHVATMYAARFTKLIGAHIIQEDSYADRLL